MAGVSNKIALIIALWVAGILAGGQFAKVSVIFPEFRSLYPEQTDQIAWLLTLVSVVGAIFGGAAASLANRFGLRHVLIASLIAAGSLSCWQSTYPSFALMAASRVIEGVTHLGIVVTAPALMAEISSERWRGTSMALWGTFFGVSFAAFGWFGIPFVDEFGISGLLQLHGVSLFVVATLIWFLLRTHNVSDSSGSGSHPKHMSAFLAFQDARVIWPGVGWLFYTLTFLALLTILPSQLSEELRPQLTTAMSLVGIAAGMIILPIALIRFKATTLVFAGFLLAGITAAIGVWIDPTMHAIMLFAILGLIQSGTFAAVAQLNHTTNARTLGYGVMAQTGNLGNLIGTPLLLSVLEVSGHGTLLFTTSAIYGVGFLTLLYVARRIQDIKGLG
ncbi:MFS transporter [Roseobacter litoralis]|uniref:MFS transporter n=1 Tax=Roseobacter litoralis TaxID=42443 RepID=UPI002494BB05|nr:MFS transporter [Roseobacter litoralis]